MRLYLYVGILFVTPKRKPICLIGFPVHKYASLFPVNLAFGSVSKAPTIHDDLTGNVFELSHKFHTNGQKQRFEFYMERD